MLTLRFVYPLLLLALAPLPARAAASIVDSLPRSAAAAQGFGHYAPGGALAVGALATLAPAFIATATSSAAQEEDFGWEAPLLIGATVGVWAGPAVGLASGGRDDLARRGLIVRTVGLAATAGGLYGIYTMMTNEESDAGSIALFSVGLAGAAFTALSTIHDLAITPSAVARGRRGPHPTLALRRDGALAVQVKL